MGCLLLFCLYVFLFKKELKKRQNMNPWRWEPQCSALGDLFSAVEVDGWLGGNIISKTGKMAEVLGDASWIERQFLCFGCSDPEALSRR